MKIAIIGSGNIGGVLARGLAKAGHEIIIGARDTNSKDVAELIQGNNSITVDTITRAAQKAEVIIVAVPLNAVPDVAHSLKGINNKVIIETSNAFGKPLPQYGNGTTAIKQITGNEDVVKCFNSIGAEDLANPNFSNLKADGFVAGNSKAAKQIAQQLCTDMGFDKCYDLGGDEAWPLLENLAVTWGALAFKAGLGRRTAFKILHD